MYSYFTIFKSHLTAVVLIGQIAGVTVVLRVHVLLQISKFGKLPVAVINPALELLLFYLVFVSNLN